MTAQLQSYASCQLRASRPLALCAPLPFPVHFCTPVLLTTHTWFASGYRRRSRRLPVVVDVLDTTIFITILLARPFGEVVLQLLFLYRAATASGRGVVVATVFPTAVSSRRPPPDPPPPPPPPRTTVPDRVRAVWGRFAPSTTVLLLPARCALCCITPFRCLVSPVSWLRGGGGSSTFVLGPPTCTPESVLAKRSDSGATNEI